MPQAKPKTPFGLRIQTEELKQWLEMKSKREGRSINNLINRILETEMKLDQKHRTEE